MTRFLLGALVMGAVFALTSFALHSSSNTAIKPVVGPAWTVSQYQLDRAFRVPLTITNSAPTTSQMGPGGGIIITQVVLATGSPDLIITINGVSEHLLSLGGTLNYHVYEFNPPLIVRPNNTLTFSTTTYNMSAVIAGYTTLPGET